MPACSVRIRILFILCVALVCSSHPMHAQSTEAIIAYKAPNEGGPRRLEVVSQSAAIFSAPALDSDRIAAAPVGEVLSNLGCALVADTVWCGVKALGKRTKGYVPAKHVLEATGPDGHVATGIDDSRSRARRKNFDAMAQVLCAQERGQALGNCAAAVARAGGGDATVSVTFTNGFVRQLYFTHGFFMRGSSTMSGVGTDVEWALKDGTYHIRVDDQKFEVPEAFVLGN